MVSKATFSVVQAQSLPTDCRVHGVGTARHETLHSFYKWGQDFFDHFASVRPFHNVAVDVEKLNSEWYMPSR